MKVGAVVVYFRRKIGHIAPNRCFYCTIYLCLVFFQTLNNLLQLLQNIKK